MAFNALDFLRLANRQGSFPPEFFAFLSDAWDELSFAYTRLDPAKRLLRADHFPGYLTTECDEWIVFVPWSLVTSFPDEETLLELLQVGISVAIRPISNLCISGSAAGLGHDIVIGDLDYCQYVELSPSAILEKAEQFIPPSENRVLVSASYGNHNEVVACAPWPEKWPQLAAAMAGVTTVENAKRFMIDFLSGTERFGLLPSSTVVLAAQFTDRTLGAAERSFVFQEAVAVPKSSGVAPVWTLVDPSQLGDYLRFLLDQIREKIASEPLKAVKRALSVAHTTRLDPFVSEALEILQSPEAGAYTKKSRAAKLIRLMARFQPEEREALSSYMQAPSGETALLDSLDDSLLETTCSVFVARFLGEVDRLNGQLDQ